MEIFLIAALTGVFVYSILTLLLSSNEKVIMRGRLSKYFKKIDIDEIQHEVLKQKQGKDEKKKLNQFQLLWKELSNRLAMSGIKLTATEFVWTWALTLTVPVLITLLLSKNIITCIGVGTIGLVVPPLVVYRARKKRQSEFDKQLGGSLTIMENSIKAGFSFQQAMESIAKEMPPPISTEFAKVLREVHYGSSMEEALKRLVERAKNKDLDLLVSSVLISAKVGGNLSEMLEVISYTLRDRLKIKSEVRILTTAGRTSGIIIGLLPIIIILVLMVINPDYFQSFVETVFG